MITPSTNTYSSPTILVRLLSWGCFCILVGLVFLPATAQAASLYWVGASGDSVNTNANDWNTSDPGACNDAGGDASAVPGSSDIAIFDADCDNNAVIDGNWSVKGINMNSGYAGTLTQNNTYTLTIGSSDWIQAAGTFTGGDSAIDLNDAFTLSGGTFTATSGTMTVSGAWDSSAGGTFDPNGGTVEFDGVDLNVDVATSETFNNFTANTTTWVRIANTDTLQVDGTLTLTNGGVIAENSSDTATLNAKGPISVAATFDGGTSNAAQYIATLLINGASAQSFAVPAGANMFDTNLNQASTTISTSGSGTVTWEGLFTLQAGNFNGGTVAHDFYSITISGGAFTATSATMTVSSAWDSSAGGTFDPNGGTVEFDGSDLNVDVATSETFDNLKVNVTTWFRIANTDTLQVDGTLTLTNGGVIAENSSDTATLNAKGPISVAATFDGGTSNAAQYIATLLINGASAQSFAVPAGANMFDTNLNQASTTISTSGSGTVTWEGLFTLQAGNFTGGTITHDFKGITTSGGTFTATSGTMTVSGDWDSSAGGTFDPNGGTVEIDGDDLTMDVNTSETFDNFTVNVPTHNKNFYIANTDTLQVDGTLTLTNGEVFAELGSTANTATLNAKGPISVAATFDGGGNTNFYKATLLIDGASAQSFVVPAGAAMPPTTLNQASTTISTSGSGTVTWDGPLTVSAGTLSLGGNNLTATGTFTIETGGNFQWNGDETLSKDPTLDSGSTVTYDKTSGSTAIQTWDYHHLAINGSGGIFTLGADEATVGDLTVTAGTFDLDGYELDVNGAVDLDGTLDAGAGADGNVTINAAGNWDMTGGTFTNTNSTVIFDGGATQQNITVDNEAFNDVQIGSSSAGAVVATADNLNIDGNLSVNNAAATTLNLTDDTLLFAGSTFNLTNLDTFTVTSSTVTFDGTSQTIAGSSTFNNFTKTEGADDSTDETLTFTAGTTQTITGTWTLDGRDDNDRINLVSSSPGTAWSVNPTAFAIDFADVTDSTNTSATDITCTSDTCTDGGSNTNWDFDTTAATISSVTAAALTQTAATITWTTNEIASSQVDQGLTDSYGTTTTETDTSPRVTSHSVNLTGLTCATTYHYRATGTDASANTTTGTNNTFTTTGCDSSSGPVVIVQDTDPDPISEPDASPLLTFLSPQTDTTTDDQGRQITTIPLNTDITIVIKPVDADRLKSLTLTIGSTVYTLKPTYQGSDPEQLSLWANNPTYSTTINFTSLGFKAYTLKADYGSTDRKTQGLFWVTTTTETPTPVQLPAPTRLAVRLSFPSFVPELGFAEAAKVIPVPANETTQPPFDFAQGKPLTPVAPTVFDKLGLAITDTFATIGNFFKSTTRTTTIIARAAITSVGDLLATLGSTTLATFNATGTFVTILTTQTYTAITSQQQSITAAISSAYNQATNQASTTLSAARQQSQDALAASQRKFAQLQLRPAQLLEEERRRDPRIPDHLRDHRYEEVQVRIATAEGQPLAGVHLTLLSEPKEAVTDDQGFASFPDVPIGQHTLKIAFGKFKGEQQLFFKDDVPKLLVNITPSLNEGIHPLITLALVLAAGVTVWFVAKRRFTGHFVV